MTPEEEKYQKELEKICTDRTEQIRLTMIMNQRLIAGMEQAKDALEAALKLAANPLVIKFP